MRIMVQTLIKVGNDFNSSIILESLNIDECERWIQEYIKTHHYYSRILYYGHYICVDYSIWSDFIYVYYFDFSDKNSYLKEVLR